MLFWRQHSPETQEFLTYLKHLHELNLGTPQDLAKTLRSPFPNSYREKVRTLLYSRLRQGLPLAPLLQALTDWSLQASCMERDIGGWVYARWLRWLITWTLVLLILLGQGALDHQAPELSVVATGALVGLVGLYVYWRKAPRLWIWRDLSQSHPQSLIMRLCQQYVVGKEAMHQALELERQDKIRLEQWQDIGALVECGCVSLPAIGVLVWHFWQALS